MKTINKIADFLDKVVQAVCVAGILAVFAVLVIQVVVRKLGGSLSWAGELTRYITLVMIIYGAALGARHGTAIRISVFLNRMPKGVRKWVEVVEYALVLFLSIITTYSMYIGTMALGDQTLAVITSIKLSWVYWIIFAGLILMDLYLLLYIVTVILNGVQEETLEEMSEEDAEAILSDIKESKEESE